MEGKSVFAAFGRYDRECQHTFLFSVLKQHRSSAAWPRHYTAARPPSLAKVRPLSPRSTAPRRGLAADRPVRVYAADRQAV